MEDYKNFMLEALLAPAYSAICSWRGECRRHEVTNVGCFWNFEQSSLNSGLINMMKKKPGCFGVLAYYYRTKVLVDEMTDATQDWHLKNALGEKPSPR